MIDSLYAAVKRRLVAFAVTSGSGAAAALRLPSSEEGGAPFVFIPSPRPIVHLSASPYSKHFLPSCLALVGREGPEVTANPSLGGNFGTRWDLGYDNPTAPPARYIILRVALNF